MKKGRKTRIRICSYRSLLKFLFYLLSFEKKLLCIPSHNFLMFLNRKDYIIVYMLLSMTPLCYGTTDILNLITDGSLWNNYKEKIGQQPQWFHASSSCVFSTILSSPSTLKNNVNYQPDHTAGDWEVDSVLSEMVPCHVWHSKPRSLQKVSPQPARLAGGHAVTTAKVSPEQHARFTGCSDRATHTLNNGFAEHRVFLPIYKSELKKWNLSVRILYLPDFILWHSFPAPVKFPPLHEPTN